MNSSERFKQVAADWLQIKGTADGDSFAKKAKLCKKLNEASKEDDGASAILARCHYRKMTELVSLIQVVMFKCQSKYAFVFYILEVKIYKWCEHVFVFVCVTN